jgi:hypothetical protein
MKKLVCLILLCSSFASAETLSELEDKFYNLAQTPDKCGPGAFKKLLEIAEKAYDIEKADPNQEGFMDEYRDMTHEEFIVELHKWHKQKCSMFADDKNATIEMKGNK